MFTTEYNSFENYYLKSSGDKGVLKNQLLLNLNGYRNVDGESIAHTYTYDLLEVPKRFKIADGIVISDEEDNVSTNHKWEISLAFNNYRDYNQINNSGKTIKGNLTFEITNCSRMK